jgi:hypothetical protein
MDKKLFSLCLLMATVLVSAPAARCEEPGREQLWRYVHPGAQSLIGIDWACLQRSPVGDWLEHRWTDDQDLPGAELLNQVDYVLISSPGAATSGEQPPVLIALAGRFDPSQVRKVLESYGTRREMFGPVELFRPRDKRDDELTFALISSKVILVGDRQSLYTAIERAAISQKEHPTDALLGRGRTMAAAYDGWTLMDAPGSLARQGFLLAGLVGNLTGETKGYEAGLSVRDGLAIDISATAGSDKAARGMVAGISRSVQRSPLASKLRVASEGEQIQVSLRMNEEEVSASLHIPLRPTLSPSRQTFATIDTPAKTTNKLSPPPKEVIRIEGLDDGPRELPFAK